MSVNVAHPDLVDLSTSPGRLIYLDRFRIGLTVLVVLHHVAMAYGAGGLGFYYVDLPDTFISRNLLVFVLGNQAWFMGAFFLVAGYFTPRSLDRKGTSAFMRSRAMRLGIPLVVYCLVLNPLAMTGWFHVSEELGPMSWDTFDYWDQVRMGPTWFLALLLIFSVVYASWRAISIRRVADPVRSKAPGLAVIALFAATLAVVEYFLRMQVAVGESWGGFPSLAYLAQYAAFFGVGVVAARHDWVRMLPTSTGAIGIGAALAASVLLFPLAFSGEWFSLELSEAVSLAMGDGNWQSGVYAAWDATLAVGLTLGIIVSLRAMKNRERALGRMLARSSYATYLVHIPIVVYVAVLISDTGLSHTGRLMLAAVVAVPASFAVATLVRKLPGVSRVL
jgi:peptidoglycan/LPS O-acetylase OafA/YrhL